MTLIKRWAGMPQIKASYAALDLTYDDVHHMLCGLYNEWLFDPDVLFIHPGEERYVLALFPRYLFPSLDLTPVSEVRSFVNPYTGTSIEVLPRSGIPAGQMVLSITEGLSIPGMEQLGIDALAMDVGRLIRLEQTNG